MQVAIVRRLLARRLLLCTTRRGGGLSARMGYVRLPRARLLCHAALALTRGSSKISPRNMNIRTSLFGILSLAFVIAGAQQLAPNAPKDQPVGSTAGTLSDFEKAIAPSLAEAKNTYPEARKRFLAGLPKQHVFFLTTRIVDPDGTFEQVFVYVLKIDAEKKEITGIINSPLQVVRTFKQGQTITFPETKILDWTISKPDGTEEGNYIGKFLDEYQKKKLNQPPARTP